MIVCLPALAANLATHDLRVITCNGGEATPYYLRQIEIAVFKVGLADFTWSVRSVNVSVSSNFYWFSCACDHDFGNGVKVRCDKAKGSTSLLLPPFTVICTGLVWPVLARMVHFQT